VVGVLVLLCCGGGSFVVLRGAVDGGSASGGEPVAIGQPARDGKFEFVVSKIDCGATKIGKGVLAQTAQGVWCKVDLSVRNIGSEAQLFTGDAQKAIDAAGVQYSNDAGAELFAGDANSFLTDINPGNKVSGFLLFDVPKGTKLTKLELHDSPFSGGVTVTLT
jgi:hypothetical protein